MKNLKQLRLSRHLTQQQLAMRMDLAQQTIYKYENCISEPDIHTLIRFANFFDTSVDYLIGNTDNPQRPGTYRETALTAEELEHIRAYRSMPNKMHHLINELVSELSVYDE